MGQCYARMAYEDADATFLRLFECFMESAPQLVLHFTLWQRKTHSNLEMILSLVTLVFLTCYLKNKSINVFHYDGIVTFQAAYLSYQSCVGFDDL